MLRRLTGRITVPFAITILIIILIIISEDNEEKIIKRVEDEGGNHQIIKAISSKHSEDGYYIFSNNSDVTLWIDVPNSFPWRKCLQEYMGMMFTYQCLITSHKQILTVKTINKEDGSRFRLVLDRGDGDDDGDGDHCIEPEGCEGYA